MTDAPGPATLERRLTALLGRIALPTGPHPELTSKRSFPGEGGKPLVPAAVLVPLVVDERGVSVVLTLRNANLKSHPGQISFPGGRVEEDDPDVAHTAIRETHEELGVAPDHVRVIGALAPVHTGTGYSVVPVMGLIPPAYPYVPDAREVAEVFDVPLRFLLDPANHTPQAFVVEGRRRQYYEILYRGHRIWGATANMIVSLYQKLERDAVYMDINALLAQP
jgi:8-oxo-dGTP pyrophosphatase MutT (NUDIX family)